MKRITFFICPVVCALLAGPVAAQTKEAEAAEREAVLKALKAKAAAIRAADLRARELKRLAEIKAAGGRSATAPTTRRGSSTGSRPTTGGAVPKADSKKFALTLADDTKLIGEPVGLAKVAVKTTFGIVHVPLEVINKVESVKNASIIKIYFRNGDVVSGELQANELRFKTSYGVVKFAANELVRMQWGTKFVTKTANVTRSAPIRIYRGRSGRFGGRFGGGTMPIPIRGGFAPPGGFDAAPATPFR